MSAKGLDLETFRAILADDRRWITIGVVVGLNLAKDNSCLRVKVSILPEQKVCVVDMAWAHTGAGSGMMQFPQPQDLVLVAFADGNHEHGFVIARLTSQQDSIPARAGAGHLVLGANPGTQADLTSDTHANVVAPRITLGKAPETPAAPLVLGDVMLTYLGALHAQLDAIIGKLTGDPLVICGGPGQFAQTNPALITDLNAIKSSLDNLKSTYVDTASSNVVSQVAFTERGP